MDGEGGGFSAHSPLNASVGGMRAARLAGSHAARVTNPSRSPVVVIAGPRWTETSCARRDIKGRATESRQGSARPDHPELEAPEISYVKTWASASTLWLCPQPRATSLPTGETRRLTKTCAMLRIRASEE